MTDTFEPRVLLRRWQVESYTGLKRSTLYDHIKRGTFPKPILLSKRSVAWPAGDVAALIEARIAGLPDAEIRRLVAVLEAARKSAAQRD
jgi:prophage regulatory protein